MTDDDGTQGLNNTDSHESDTASESDDTASDDGEHVQDSAEWATNVINASAGLEQYCTSLGATAHQLFDTEQVTRLSAHFGL